MAIKYIIYSGGGLEDIEKEIKIMKMTNFLKDPNIIKLYEIYNIKSKQIKILVLEWG